MRLIINDRETSDKTWASATFEEEDPGANAGFI
jgi:hypothetical protein